MLIVTKDKINTKLKGQRWNLTTNQKKIIKDKIKT